MGLLLGCGNSATPSMQSAAPKPPDEKAALSAIAKTNEAQTTYFKVNRRYALTYDELVEARFLAAEPSASQTGYDFRLRPAADAQTYKLSVSPAALSPAAPHFFTDQSGVIHTEAGKEATADSPVLSK